MGTSGGKTFKFNKMVFKSYLIVMFITLKEKITLF